MSFILQVHEENVKWGGRVGRRTLLVTVVKLHLQMFEKGYLNVHIHGCLSKPME